MSDDKPQFLETDLIFKAFDEACDGKVVSVENLKPEAKWIGETLTIKQFGHEHNNIVNRIIRSFIKENSDMRYFHENNHLAIRRVGSTFQLISLFPEIDLKVPDHFIWRDEENYYIYKLKRNMGTVSVDYLVRHQPDFQDITDQYFLSLPLKIYWFEVSQVLVMSDKKKFFMAWASFMEQPDRVPKPLDIKMFRPLQRALDENLMLSMGHTFLRYKPTELNDYIHEAVDHLWTKNEHKSDKNFRVLPDATDEAMILMRKFIQQGNENRAFQANIKQIKAEGMTSIPQPIMSQEEVDKLLK